LEHAQELLAIPTSSEYPSLNLAAAVQIVCYELCACAGTAAQSGEPHVPVPQDEMERFFEHLERVIITTRFLNPDNPRFLMRR
ncbi:hypothetical protein ABTM32_23010, partial [Acinetobacter baumannii]